MQSKIIVGDIHGGSVELNNLLRLLPVDSHLPIFLGDYVNRGNNSKGVLDILVKIQKSGRPAKFLCGNHDWALNQYILRNTFDSFALMGGLSTLRSYLGDHVQGNVYDAFMRAIPDSHRNFLGNLEAFYEDTDLFCSHTGLAPLAPTNHTFEQTVLQSHLDMFRDNFHPAKMCVCGHYPQTSGLPLVRENLVCVDTGCGTSQNGWLTALVLPEKKFLQVNSLGDSRWLSWELAAGRPS